MNSYIAQAKYILGASVVVPFLPWLLYKGKTLWDSMPDLPESGPRQGLIGASADRPIRLLSIGESTIAGVGVQHQADGLTGQMAQSLHQITGRSVEWQILAKTGLTARQVHEELAHLVPEEPVDLLLIGLGGNDTFKLNYPRRWRRYLLQLLETIRERQPESPILLANLPPVGEFSSFPWYITGILGQLVRLHASAIEDLPEQIPNLYFNNRPITVREWQEQYAPEASPEAFFSDGVHPSALTYQLWGQELAQFTIDRNII